MFDRLTRAARRVIERAQEEARLLGQDFLGTEHLLLGLFAEEHTASRALRRLGVDRDHLLRAYRGTGMCGPVTSPAPDASALASVGIDLDEVRRRVESAFGSGALEGTRAWQRAVGLRLTDRTKRVLELAIRAAERRGSERAGPEELLLALASGPGLAAALLRRRGISVAAIQAALGGKYPRPA